MACPKKRGPPRAPARPPEMPPSSPRKLFEPAANPTIKPSGKVTGNAIHHSGVATTHAAYAIKRKAVTRPSVRLVLAAAVAAADGEVGATAVDVATLFAMALTVTACN